MPPAVTRADLRKLQKAPKTNRLSSVPAQAALESTPGYKQLGAGVGKDWVTSLNAASLSTTALRTAPCAAAHRAACFPGGC